MTPHEPNSDLSPSSSFYSHPPNQAESHVRSILLNNDNHEQYIYHNQYQHYPSHLTHDMPSTYQTPYDQLHLPTTSTNYDHGHLNPPPPQPLSRYERPIQHFHPHPRSQQPDPSSFEPPKFGQTRCYWALLDSELKFLCLDPALQSHMSTQSPALAGKCILDFIHAEEQESARNDLMKTLQKKALTGSVTRVRMMRLTAIRRALGATPDQLSTFPHASKIAFDEHYLTCHMVINWAAEGVVLCFIHAIVDISPFDNDERSKSEWTNWCGTPVMTDEHASTIQKALNLMASPSYPVPSLSLQKALLIDPLNPQQPIDRVFQILRNNAKRPVLFSWPPKEYHLLDFSSLGETVNLESEGGGGGANTTCTRRFRVTSGPETTKNPLWGVESIYIPHGSIIFVCHRLERPRAPGGPMYTPNPNDFEAPHGYEFHHRAPLHQEPPLQQNHQTVFGYPHEDPAFYRSGAYYEPPPPPPPPTSEDPAVYSTSTYQQHPMATTAPAYPGPVRGGTDVATGSHNPAGWGSGQQTWDNQYPTENAVTGLGLGPHPSQYYPHPPPQAQNHHTEPPSQQSYAYYPAGAPQAPLTSQTTQHGPPPAPQHQYSQTQVSEHLQAQQQQQWFNQQNTSPSQGTASPGTPPSYNSASSSSITSAVTSSSRPSLPRAQTTGSVYHQPVPSNPAQPTWMGVGAASGDYASPVSTGGSSASGMVIARPNDAAATRAHGVLPTAGGHPMVASADYSAATALYGLSTPPSSDGNGHSRQTTHAQPQPQQQHLQPPHPVVFNGAQQNEVSSGLSPGIPVVGRAHSSSMSSLLPPRQGLDPLPKIRTDFTGGGAGAGSTTRGGSSASVSTPALSGLGSGVTSSSTSNSPEGRGRLASLQQHSPYAPHSRVAEQPRSELLTNGSALAINTGSPESVIQPHHPMLQLSTAYHQPYFPQEVPSLPPRLQPLPPSPSQPLRTTARGELACGSRAGGKPPPGVTECVTCKTAESPEWRKGPTGLKNLCNACGLRYARSKQKEDPGYVSIQRKRKDAPLGKASTTKKRRSQESESPSSGGGRSLTNQNSPGPPSSTNGAMTSSATPEEYPAYLQQNPSLQQLHNAQAQMAYSSQGQMQEHQTPDGAQNSMFQPRNDVSPDGRDANGYFVQDHQLQQQHHARQFSGSGGPAFTSASISPPQRPTQQHDRGFNQAFLRATHSYDPEFLNSPNGYDHTFPPTPLQHQGHSTGR